MTISATTYLSIEHDELEIIGTLVGPMLRNFIVDHMEEVASGSLEQLVEMLDGQLTEREIAIGIKWVSVMVERYGEDYVADFPSVPMHGLRMVQ